MKFTGRIATALVAGALIAAPAITVAQPTGAQYNNGYGQPGPQGPGGWDAPPDNFRQDVQRQGWRDGLDGARKDAGNHRNPNVRNRDEYRNYRGPARRAYRDAFQRGYNAFWSHQGRGFGGPRPY